MPDPQRSEQQRYAIGRSSARRRAARLRDADRILRDVVAVGRPDFRRERERAFVDAFFNRIGILLDGPLSARKICATAAVALRDAGWRCAIRDLESRATRRKARAMMRDPRVHSALRDRFQEAGLTGELIAKRLKTIIETEDAENSLKAIDIAIKVTGDYAPTKQQNLNVNASRAFFGDGSLLESTGKPIADIVQPALPTPHKEIIHAEPANRDQFERIDHRHHSPDVGRDHAARRHRDDDDNDSALE